MGRLFSGLFEVLLFSVVLWYSFAHHRLKYGVLRGKYGHIVIVSHGIILIYYIALLVSA